MLINYPYKFRLEPTEEQETLLYHYGFTCRFIYNLALDQRNLSRDPNPARIMNKTIKFLCWIAVIVVLYACGSTSQTPPAVEEPQEVRQKENTTLYWDSGLERWKTDGDPEKDEVYVGEVRNGVPHGQGIYSYPEGGRYVGESKDGKLYGQGTYTWPNGTKYVGEWRDSQRHGSGIRTYVDGSKYVGEYKNSKRHGQGIFTWASGERFGGEFRNNKRWQGVQYDNQGVVTKNWEAGTAKSVKPKLATLYRDSERQQWYAKGNPKKDGVYVGEIRKGVPHGKGTVTFPDGKKYVGEWQDGKFHGQGTYTWPDGGKYVGEFKDGHWHGQGTLTNPDGGEYVGEFKDNKMHGQGTFTLPDGKKYVGEWRDNKPLRGTLYDQYGNTVNSSMRFQ